MYYPTHINELPNDQFFEIFKKIELKEYCKIALVCKKWNELIHQPIIWKPTLNYLNLKINSNFDPYTFLKTYTVRQRNLFSSSGKSPYRDFAIKAKSGQEFLRFETISKEKGLLITTQELMIVDFSKEALESSCYVYNHPQNDFLSEKYKYWVQDETLIISSSVSNQHNLSAIDLRIPHVGKDLWKFKNCIPLKTIKYKDEYNYNISSFVVFDRAECLLRLLNLRTGEAIHSISIKEFFGLGWDDPAKNPKPISKREMNAVLENNPNATFRSRLNVSEQNILDLISQKDLKSLHVEISRNQFCVNMESKGSYKSLEFLFGHTIKYGNLTSGETIFSRTTKKIKECLTENFSICVRYLLQFNPDIKPMLLISCVDLSTNATLLTTIPWPQSESFPQEQLNDEEFRDDNFLQPFTYSKLQPLNADLDECFLSLCNVASMNSNSIKKGTLILFICVDQGKIFVKESEMIEKDTDNCDSIQHTLDLVAHDKTHVIAEIQTGVSSLESNREFKCFAIDSITGKYKSLEDQSSFFKFPHHNLSYVEGSLMLSSFRNHYAQIFVQDFGRKRTLKRKFGETFFSYAETVVKYAKTFFS